jgi:hypothetical protein
MSMGGTNPQSSSPAPMVSCPLWVSKVVSSTVKAWRMPSLVPTYMTVGRSATNCWRRNWLKDSSATSTSGGPTTTGDEW